MITKEEMKKYEPKYGSYIADLEESVAAKDWEQVARDVAALRRHHIMVMACRKQQANEFLGIAACPVCGAWNALSYWRDQEGREIERRESCRCRPVWDGEKWI